MTTRAWRDRGRVWTCPLSLDTYNAIATQQTLFTISGSNNSQNESKWQYKRVNISSIECVTTKIRTKWNKLSPHLIHVLTPRAWWKVWDVTVPCDVCSHSGNSHTFASILHCAVHGCNSEGHWGCCQGYEITEGISPHCHRHTYCICHDDRKGQSPPSARSCSSSLRSHTINVPPHAALAIVVVLDSSTNPTRGYSPLDCRVLAVFWHLGHFSTMSHILLGIYKKMQRRKLPSNVGDGGYHQFLQVPNQVSLAGKHWFPNPALILKGHILCPLLWYAQRTVIGGRLFRWL